MDRQVAAVFGGIVVVGLGPAIWVGTLLFRPGPLPPAPQVAVTTVVSAGTTMDLDASPSASPTASLSSILPGDGLGDVGVVVGLTGQPSLPPGTGLPTAPTPSTATTAPSPTPSPGTPTPTPQPSPVTQTDPSTGITATP